MKNLNNKTQLIGRVTENAILRVTENKKQVVNFTLAVDDSYKNQEGERIERTDFIEVERWFAPEKNVKMQNFFTKGALFMIEGKTISKAYINNDGEIVQKLGLNMSNSFFLSKPKNSTEEK